MAAVCCFQSLVNINNNEVENGTSVPIDTASKSESTVPIVAPSAGATTETEAETEKPIPWRAIKNE